MAEILAAADRPPQYPTSTCTGARCGAPIIWAIKAGTEGTRSPVKVPIDAEPVSVSGGGATHLLKSRGDGVAPLAEEIRDQGRLFGRSGPVWRSHFRTCPAAEGFRGRSQFAPARRGRRR